MKIKVKDYIVRIMIPQAITPTVKPLLRGQLMRDQPLWKGHMTV